MTKKSTLIVFLFISVFTFLIFHKHSQTPPFASEQGDRDHPNGAMQFRHAMIAGHNGFIDPQSRMNAIDHTMKKLMPGNRLMKTNGISGWTPIGPGNIGGRIRSIIISSTNTKNMLVGAVAGGIWKSTNGGASWTSKLDGGIQQAIGCMVKDPTNENIVYAGTGEGWWNIDFVYGGGIYKSTDFGETWNLLPSTIGTNILNFSNVRTMAFDGVGNLYAVTFAFKYNYGQGKYFANGDLYKSSDGGSSWVSIGPTPRATNYFNGVDVIPFNSNVIIFATADNGATNGGIYRTTDGGTTWNQITANLPTSNYGRIAFAKDPNTNVAYAQFESYNYSSPDYGLAGIFKSNDNGANWSAVPKPGNIASTGDSPTTNSSFLGTQGGYDNVIAVDPFNSSNIYVGGIDMMKSTDGGASWYQLTFWDQYYGSPVVHADHHAIVFDPVTPNIVYSGDDGGIQKSTDGGNTWTSLNNNLAITQFYSGAVFPTGNTYFGGTQDNGHLKFGGGTSWGEVESGDGGYAAQDQSNASIAYEEYVYLQMNKSTNGGLTWSDCSNSKGLEDATSSDLCLFIAPFVLNQMKSTVLLAGSDKVWATVNSAGSWKAVSSTLSTGQQVSALAVTNSVSPFLGFAGTTDGHVFKCTGINVNSATNTWVDISPTGNNGAWVRRITIDPNNQQNIYASYSGYNNDGVFPSKHIWYSSDQGTTWSDISGDLPDVPVHSLLVDNNTPTTLYIGTETGVYESTNRGTNWISASTGMPTFVPVDELVYQKGSNYIFAFTHGRSAFMTTLPTPVLPEAGGNNPVSFELSQNYPNPFNPSTLIKYSIPSAGNVKVSVYNIKGELVKTLVNQYQETGNYSIKFDGNGLPSGVYLYKVESGSFNQVKKMVLQK